MKRTVPMQTDQESSLSVIFFSHTEHTRVSPGPHELREGAAIHSGRPQEGQREGPGGGEAPPSLSASRSW